MGGARRVRRCRRERDGREQGEGGQDHPKGSEDGSGPSRGVRAVHAAVQGLNCTMPDLRIFERVADATDR